MWAQVLLTILLLSLPVIGCERTKGSKKLRHKQYNSRDEHKLSRLVKKATYGSDLCLNKSKHLGISESDAFIKADLSCTSSNSTSYVMIIQRHRTLRSLSVSVLNKVAWVTCPIQVCSVTHVCSSLAEQDCKLVEGKGNNNIGKSNASPKSIAYITISGRYNDIILGQGQHLEQPYRILTFNVTNNFTVREHVVTKIKLRVLKFGHVTGGITTGPCYVGQGSCVYMCYKIGKRYFKLCIFKEPDIDQVEQYGWPVEYDFINANRILSIAMTKNYCIYSLIIHDIAAEIKVVCIMPNKRGHFHMKPTMKWSTLLKPSALDITKDGSKVLLVINRRMNLLTPNNLVKKYIAHTELYDFHELREINQIVSWLHDGEHAVFMNKEFPYNAKKVPLVRR